MTGLSPGQLATQVDFAWELLRKIDLAGDRAFNPDYSQVNVSAIRKMTYLEQWRFYIQNNIFDFQLSDESIIQFRVSRDSKAGFYSLCYYECPYRAISYAEFLRRRGFIFSEVGESLLVEYDLASMSNPLKESVTPSRYDYAPDQYKEGSHPASHIHLGHLSEVRLGTRRILKPLSFFCFVLRQYYPAHWRKLLRVPLPGLCAKHIRAELEEVPKKFLNKLDEHETFLA